MRALLLTLLLASAATARDRAAELQVSRQGDRYWVRVTARNTAERRLPIQVSVYARASVGPWLLVRAWPVEHDLPPGHKLRRELFTENSGLLRLLGHSRRLQVRAVVTGPGLRGVAEQILPQTATRR